MSFKRYIVFAGNAYYPHGGMQDFNSDHDRLSDAIEAAEKTIITTSHWSEVYDAFERKTMERFGTSRLGEEHGFNDDPFVDEDDD